MANNGPIELNLPEPLVLHIVVSAGHSYFVKKGQSPLIHDARLVEHAELVAGRGIRGDRYFQKRLNHPGQVTLMAIESIHEIRQAFNVPELPVSVFRRNLIVSQTNLAALVGRQFAIQDVQFEGVQECSPCRWMDQMVGKGAKAFMQHHFRGGLRAKILTDGVLSVRRGDER